MASLDRLGEQGFIDLVARLSRAQRPRPVVGIGDDAAVLALPSRAHVLLTTDFLTEGIHFRAAYTPGFLLGRKALAVNLSDIAAMGGVPHACVAAIGFPRGTSERFARDVAAGLAQQARRFGVALVGGDTCAARALFVGVTLLGLVEPGRAVRRRGARPGDALYVTGGLGGSGAGLALLRGGARVLDRRGGRIRAPGLGRGVRGQAARAILAHLDPQPRVRAGRALGLTGLATAMIDLSDGLAQDLRRLCRDSGTGALIEEAAIPVDPAARAILGSERGLSSALFGGEDYELLFAARPRDAPAIARLARRTRMPIARVGQVMRRARGIQILKTDGRYVDFPAGGFEHFPRRGA